jgi:RHS repeat-associated protein
VAVQDPFVGASPAFDSPAPEPANINLGDFGVAEQRGAATHTYQIPVPPGRNGMAPSLALRYSSQAPIRGGIAVGWTLDLPAIRIDTSQGVQGERTYTATLNGVSGRLVKVQDRAVGGGETYRVDYDRTFTRFERLPDGGGWLALTTDGVRHYFDEKGSNRASDAVTRWRISRQVDTYGNTIDYFWHQPRETDKLARTDFAIRRIEYSSNNNAVLKPHAKVEFDYAPVESCEGSRVPIGAAFDSHVRGYFEGARRLTAIVTSVRDTPEADWRIVRRVSLGYDEEYLRCDGTNASLRYLTEIRVSAFDREGNVVSLPPETFQYGRQERRWESEALFAGDSHGLFGHSGSEEGAETTLMDMDGDGISDLVFAEIGDDGVGYLVVHRGKSGGGFEETPERLPLPTWSWLDGKQPAKDLKVIDRGPVPRPNPVPDQPRGPSAPRGFPTLSLTERLTLGGQLIYRVVPVKSGCPARDGCPFEIVKGYLSYHFLDYNKNGQIDLVVSIWVPNKVGHEPYHFSFPPPGLPYKHDFPGNKLSLDDATDVLNDHNLVRQEPDGVMPPLSHGFTWYVYYNTGFGFSNPNEEIVPGYFKPEPERIDLRLEQEMGSRRFPPPVPFVPSGPDVALDNGIPPQISIPPLVDLTGTGRLAYIDPGDVAPGNLGLTNWKVYVSDGTGHFPVEENGQNTRHSKSIIWHVPRFGLSLSESGALTDNLEENPPGDLKHKKRIVVAGLYDVNGDGLPDFVVKKGGGEKFLAAYLNTGDGFSDEPIEPGLGQSMEDMPIEEIQTDLDGIIFNPRGVEVPERGAKGYRRRMVDVDGDGIVDMLLFYGVLEDIADPGRVEVRINAGDGFLPARPLPVTRTDDRFGHRILGVDMAKRLFISRERTTQPESNGHQPRVEWRLRQDFIDITGDGEPELCRWTDDGSEVRGFGDTRTREAPRALRAFENGRGLRVEFTYAPSTKPDVVEWPEWGQRQRQQRMPRVKWVVRSVTVSGGHNTPETVTQYRYAMPHHAATSIPDGQPLPARFQGFERVTITTEMPKQAVGRRVEHYYEYGRDPSGLLYKEEIYRLENGVSYLHQTKGITWVQGKVLDKARFTYRSEVTTRTCPKDSTESDCHQGDRNLHRVVETWAARVPTADPTEIAERPLPPELFVLVKRREEGWSHEKWIRETALRHEIRYGQDGFRPDDYRVLTRESTVSELPSETLISRTRTKYNAAGLPERTDRYTAENRIARTKRTFDDKTGNLLSVTKPEQAALDGSGKSTRYIYDDHQLFVHKTTNELDHEVEAVHDIATAVLVEQLGPNRAPVQLTDEEPDDDPGRVEGPVGPGGSQGGDPSDVLDVPERETWKVDGLGRMIEHSISLDDDRFGYRTVPVEMITYFDTESPYRTREERLLEFGGKTWVTADRVFDGLGRLLREVEHVDGDRHAITTYEYDENGSLAATEGPDPSDDSKRVRYIYERDGLGRLSRFLRPDATGQAVSHDGLEETHVEVTGDGTGSTTKLAYDTFGRLIEVHEYASETDVSITRYRYDGNDNLSQITDADGNVTRLAHDLVGNRIEIERSGRIWGYRYDDNGNLKEKTEPVPEGARPEDYTTRYTHDDLDRVTRRIPPSRGMSSERLTQLGIGDVVFSYDQGPNGVGQLSQVELPFGKMGYEYNARGLVSREERSLTLTHPVNFNKTQWVERQYNALGRPTLSKWDDGQEWSIDYDERGLVDAVRWFDPQEGAWKIVAEYQRSLAGQPRWRLTDYPVDSDSRVASWSIYDVLGRPLQQTVCLKPRAQSCEKILSTLRYSYNGSGDVGSVTHDSDDGPRTVTKYKYDALHRLLKASEAVGPNGYKGEFSYSPAGNILSARVTWNSSPETRDVSYEYGATDPQAVDRLVNVSDGEPYADFDYDLSGNMKNRNVPAGPWRFEWDGDNMLREASGQNGAEVYYYDHAGSRVLAISQSEGVRFWFAENETHYALDGIETGRYLHLSGDGPTLARVENGTDIELQYADALQNLILSLESQGKVSASFIYGAFGEVVHASGDEDHRRQFNGKENDVFSGLRYYGFRYCDPLVLRWNSADPLYRFVPEIDLSNPQALNLYTFSLNNALRFYDPDGRQAKKASNKGQRDPNESKRSENKVEELSDSFLTKLVTGLVCGILGGCNEAHAPTLTTDISKLPDPPSELERILTTAETIIGGPLGAVTGPAKDTAIDFAAQELIEAGVDKEQVTVLKAIVKIADAKVGSATNSLKAVKEGNTAKVIWEVTTGTQKVVKQVIDLTPKPSSVPELLRRPQ